MSRVHAVLASLRDAGITVIPRDDGMLVLNPKSRVTPEIADAVRSAKPELLASLTSWDAEHAETAIAETLARIEACHRPADAAAYEAAVNEAARAKDRVAFDDALRRLEAHVVAYESGIQLADEVAS